MKIAGGTILVVATLLILFAFIYETSVPNSLFDESPSRTINLGLMQDQQNILMTGVGLLLSGVLLIVGGSIVERLESIKISNKNLLLKEIDKEKIKSTKKDDLVICAHCGKNNPPAFDNCRYCDHPLISD